MEKAIDNILTPEIRLLIEGTYYHDISKADIWHQFIVAFAQNKTDFAAQIESLSNNGIMNVRRLVSLCLENYQNVQNMFVAKSSFDANLTHFYLILLGYFHNCYDSEKKDFLLRFSKDEKIEFFYHADLENVLQDICKKCKIFVDTISTNLSKICKQQIDAVNMLRELLLLPILIENVDIKHIKDLNEFRELLIASIVDLLDKSSVKDSFTAKIKLAYDNKFQEQAFVWLKEAPLGDSFVHSLINIVYIFVFIKKIYFSCGARKLYRYPQRVLDKQSGNVLYSVPYEAQMFLLRGTSALFAGQANIDDIEITPQGDLLVNFKHGLFFDDSTTDQASFNAALAISESLLPCFLMFGTFLDSAHRSETKKFNILLEMMHENLDFSKKVQEQICYLNPEMSELVKVVPSLKIASPIEKERYLKERDFVLSAELKEKIISNIRLSGYKSNFVIPDFAFQGIKLITLMPKDILCEEGNNSVFVYIPLDEGLIGHSVVANVHFYPKAWAPVGHIGAIQDGLRTATIVAEKRVELLMIPADLYLCYWHVDYNNDEFHQRISELCANRG